MSVNILTYYHSIEPDNDDDSDLESDDDDHTYAISTLGKCILYNGNDIREIEKDPSNRHTYINECDQGDINKYLSSKKRNNPNIDITDGQQYSCYISGNTINLHYPPITSTSTKKKSRRKSKKSRKRKSVKRSKSRKSRKSINRKYRSRK